MINMKKYWLYETNFEKETRTFTGWLIIYEDGND